MNISWLVIGIGLLIPVGIIISSSIKSNDAGLLFFTLFFVPLSIISIYKFLRTKYNYAIFNLYNFPPQSNFFLRRDKPSQEEFDKFIEELKNQVTKFHYREDIPDDTKSKLILNHLEYLLKAEILTASEFNSLLERTNQKFLRNKVSSLKMVENKTPES